MRNISIAIHEQYQKQGIGSKLLDCLLELADRHLRLIRIELDVTARNERALHLYERKGFKKEGLLEKVHYSQGALQDVIIMGRVQNF
ncbi:GNAT family N-acetyltransferase [Cytobacillus horneckiae]|uniref:N-acetyltransferase n=1 Tax=Cytobacillus horneckiae TaxID=549687 RepID=A0A2N0ZD99_9BACI|nr:GNAT family protein [Cytobacillus horneckiae]MEC1158777.1 GNAT family protein [Cytobacillus horneckiae]MED2937300.1 GNAT family protein [Cytobacillus horneckiae]PKG27483.1 N-acetyltransferase [Cytobacillus horneckiae]